MSLAAFVIDQASRGRVAHLYPPKFQEFIGHHVSHQFVRGVTKNDDSSPITVFLVGHVYNDGLEAFLVKVEGTTKRPDGKTYHLTWSLDRSKGYKPVDSNTLVTTGSVQPIHPPIPVRATFAYI